MHRERVRPATVALADILSRNGAKRYNDSSLIEFKEIYGRSGSRRGRRKNCLVSSVSLQAFFPFFFVNDPGLPAVSRRGGAEKRRAKSPGNYE